MSGIQRKYLSPEEVKTKILSFCLYRERCQQEVRNKLYDLGCYKNQVEEMLTFLIQENFVNEERFANEYVHGKFTLKHWGKHKIKQGLYLLNVSEYCVAQALRTQLPADEYRATMLKLAQRKKAELSDNTAYEQYGKITNYLLQKGYEADKIKETLNYVLKGIEPESVT